MTRTIIIVWTAILLAMQLAWGHEPNSEWIRTNPNFLTKSGSHCCSWDCKPANNDMIRVPGGWLHLPTNTTLMDDERGNYTSNDEQLWRCVWGGQLQCVFTGAGT